MIHGNWCAGYLQRLENKFAKGKYNQEQFDSAKTFIVNKMQSIERMHADFDELNEEEQRKYKVKLSKLKNEMSEYFLKIINGRINSMGLRTSLKNYEDLNDIIQDAFISVITYINRYDDSRASSAFAYVTELATNGIYFSLKKINEHEEQYVSGLDYFENINTIDDPMNGKQNIENFLE